MTITSADISGKQFRMVFRGYAVEDVDEFLDELETEVTRLRAAASEVDRSGRGSVDEPAGAGAQPTADRCADRVGADAGGAGPVGTDPDAPVTAVRTVRIAEQLADQLLAEAARDADAVRGEAADEAARRLDAAQVQAEAVLADARGQADHLLAGCRAEADRLAGDLAKRRQREVAELERRCGEAQTRLDRLAAAERACRDRIVAALTEQQRVLDECAPTVEEPANGPARTAANRPTPVR